MPRDLHVIQQSLQAELVRQLKPGQLVDNALVIELVHRTEPLLNEVDVAAVTKATVAAINGLGALEPLLEDSLVSDIMVVGGHGVWIERAGQLQAMDIAISEDEASRLIERIVAPLGLRIDRSSPMVDARLPDGSRVNAIVPPIAVDGPCLTIRRFGARHIELNEIAEPELAELLIEAVNQHRNIVVSGGTGAGKTTLLNAMASHIASNERVVTIEDAAELHLPLTHVVRLEGRPANSEGVGRVTLRELVRNALRMRPDRIIVGEVRGPEALDMLQAMNTGHEGSMSTCHANTPLDALRRIETMVLMGEVELPLAAVRQQIGSAVDLIVQIARTDTAQRRVVNISEVIETENGNDVRQLADQHHVFAQQKRTIRKLKVEAA